MFIQNFLTALGEFLIGIHIKKAIWEYLAKYICISRNVIVAIGLRRVSSHMTLGSS